MFGLSVTDSNFLSGMLIILAYVGAMMSFISIANITKFQLYIRTMAVIFITGATMMITAYLSAKGYIQ